MQAQLRLMPPLPPSRHSATGLDEDLLGEVKFRHWRRKPMAATAMPSTRMSEVEWQTPA
jgi:hypothetical protein